MSNAEKRRLKREVSGAEAKTVIELLGREIVEAEEDLKGVRLVLLESMLYCALRRTTAQ
jgi:hypothetical protein